MAALLVASTTLLLAATLVALRLPRRGGVAITLSILLLTQAMIVLTVGVAGLLFRSLSGTTLAALALVWLLPAAAVTVMRPAPVAACRGRLAGYLSTLADALREPAVVIAFVIVVATLAWRTFLAIRLPVVDYDGYSYHLVFVDVWLQHNALTLVPQRPWTAGYPFLTEMLTTWLAAFTRTDALTGLTSIIPIPAAIAAVTGLARAFGAAPRWALFAGLLFAMTPGLVALAGTTYVDASSVAMVAATWWLGLRVVRGERDAAAALLLGLAGGLALGTKGTNVLLVGPVVIVAGLAFIVDLVRATGASRRATVARVVLFAVPVLVLGASWVVRNIVINGNPMYPFAAGPFAGPYTLADFALVVPAVSGRGLLDQLAISWTADWGILHYGYNVSPGGFGRAWPGIIVLGVLGLVAIARRRRIAAIALVVAPAFLTLVVMPNPWYARYALFIVAVTLPLMAVTLTGLRPRIASVTAIVLTGVAAISLALTLATPNIDVAQAFPGQHPVPKPLEYLAYVLDPNEDRRLQVGLRGECAGFDVIPDGERVGPAGWNLLHAIAGPSFSRILTDTVSAPDVDGLVAAMREQQTRWLVTRDGSTIDHLAASAPDRFADHGTVCREGHVWELRPGN